MPYKLLYGDNILFDPYVDDEIYDLNLTEEKNACAYLDFTVASSHEFYDEIKEKDKFVTLYFDDEKLFVGYVTEIEKDFYNNKEVSCISVLAFLDSVMTRPYSSTEGKQPVTAPTSIDGYFQWLIDQYNERRLGYNVEFILNTVHIPKIKISEKKDNTKIKIGLYASGDRWVKNFYNQLGAASLFKNNQIDCIPINEKTLKTAKIFKTTISGLSAPIAREKLLKRMAKNDINFYVTFSECSPLIPLESLELGVPCITSNNHHYWEGNELEKYLIVNENDDIIKIYEKAKYCLENKEKILDLYKKWKKEYDKESKKSVERFLENNL